MRTVEEIRHDDLPEDYSQLIQARVHVYVDETKTELHCFGSLRNAQRFVAALQKKHYRPLNGPVEVENPPPRRYLIWTAAAGNWEDGYVGSK